MPVLYLDLETYCTTDIKVGTFRYAEDVEITLFAYALDDAPAKVWDVTDGSPMPPDLKAAFHDPSVNLLAHNAAFDRTVLEACGYRTPIERWRCSMVLALAHGLPGSLEKLGALFGLSEDQAKISDGRRLVLKFCKPQGKSAKIRRRTRETDPEDWQRFSDYAARDVEAMRTLVKRMPRFNWTPSEVALFHMDRRINERGFAVDLDLAHAALDAADAEQIRLAGQTQDLTLGMVESATQRDVLLEYLNEECGLALPNLQAGTIEALLQNDDLDPIIADLLNTRLQSSTVSVKKYGAITRSVSSDGRLRGTLQFRGAARTGRYAGRVFQPQNLPRPAKHLTKEIVAEGVEAIKAGCVDMVTDNVMEMLSAALRGLIIAGLNRKLVVADLANIEGRVLAWLAGEEWKLDAFRDYDTVIGADAKGKPIRKGPDLYRLAYSRAFSMEVKAVSDDQRQIGKVMELALGYQGAVGAFSTMAALYGVELPEKEVLALVRAWRKAHQAIVQFWYALEAAARIVIEGPGAAIPVGRLVVDSIKRGEDLWMRIRLPSGRYLSYPQPEVDEHGKVSFMGVNPFTRKWERIKTYGGKLCIAAGTPVITDRGPVPIENVTARDRVWDGVEWVSTGGSIDNGTREVIRAHGVLMTPDHLVLTEEGWVDASQSERYHRAACRLPDGVDVRGLGRAEVAVADAMRLRRGEADARGRDAEAATSRHLGVLRLPAARNDLAAVAETRDVEASGVRRVAVDARPLSVAVTPCLAQLRRAWDHGVRALAGVLCGVLGGHGADVRAWAHAGAGRQLSGLFTGELPVGDVPRAGSQQARVAAGRSSGARGADRHLGLDALLPAQAGAAVARVHDLLDCGPRHRFVVLDDRGEPLIVHNCENAAQATAADILLHGMSLAEANGYPVVLSVHDELVTEPLDHEAFDARGLVTLMATNPPWAEGLPLAAEGYEAKRYRK